MLFRSLAHRPFALLWSGQAVSRLGDTVFRVALAWWVLDETGSAVAMGTVLIFTSVPLLIFTLAGGVFVDRLPRARLMIVSDLVRGAAVGAVAMLATAGTLELWHLYMAGTLFGFVDAFFQPAYAALVPEITPGEALPSANSLTGLTRDLSGVLGPALGAAIVAAGGTPLAFLLDAASFLVSAALLVSIARFATAPLARTASPDLLTSFREGIGTVAALPWVWVTLVLTAMAVVATSGLSSVALPLLVKTHLRADVEMLGILYSLMSAGSVLASVWLGRLPRLRRRGLGIYAGWMLGATTNIIYGLPVPWWILFVAALASGAGAAISDLFWTNALQELVPRERLGRVSSVDLFGTWALVPLGFAFDGWAADTFGAAPVFVAGGVVSFGLALLGLAQPAVQKLD